MFSYPSSFPLTDTTRPEKVGWRFVLKNNDVIESINSKGMRKILRQADELLLQQGITWELKEITKAEYLKWLEYYQQKMAEKGYRIVANEAWFDTKHAEGKQVYGFSFYQNGKVVGSGIITRKGETSSFAFKASEPLELSNKENATLGTVMNYYYLKVMVEQGVKNIQGGRSRNAFGVLNTYGYLEHKVSFYQLYLPEETEFSTEVPLDEQGNAIFYSFENPALPTLNFVHPQFPAKPLDINRFAKNDVQVREIVY